VLDYTYPLELTDPATIPEVDEDPVYYPTPIASVTNGTAILADAVAQIKEIIAGDGANCTKCKNALLVGQKAAQLVPSMIPDAMVALCEATKFASNSTCSDNYQAGSFGTSFPYMHLLRPLAWKLDCMSPSSRVLSHVPTFPITSHCPGFLQMLLRQASFLIAACPYDMKYAILVAPQLYLSFPLMLFSTHANEAIQGLYGLRSLYWETWLALTGSMSVLR
jgi:hypothetical protein